MPFVKSQGITAAREGTGLRAIGKWKTHPVGRFKIATLGQSDLAVQWPSETHRPMSHNFTLF